MNKIHNVSSLKFFQYCSQLNMIFKMNLSSLSNNILIQDQISKKWATYNVPLFLKQRIIKSWGQKFIIFLFLLHIPINLKCSKKKNIITAWKQSQSQLWHSSITVNSHRAMANDLWSSSDIADHIEGLMPQGKNDVDFLQPVLINWVT